MCVCGSRLSDIFSPGEEAGRKPLREAGKRRDSGEVPGVEMVEWRADMFGRPRFVHFRTLYEA